MVCMDKSFLSIKPCNDSVGRRRGISPGAGSRVCTAVPTQDAAEPSSGTCGWLTWRNHHPARAADWRGASRLNALSNASVTEDGGRVNGEIYARRPERKFNRCVKIRRTISESLAKHTCTERGSGVCYTYTGVFRAPAGRRFICSIMRIPAENRWFFM